MIVPRTQRSAISAFTRVFDALWLLRSGALQSGAHGATEVGPGVSRSGMKNAVSHVRDTIPFIIAARAFMARSAARK